MTPIETTAVITIKMSKKEATTTEEKEGEATEKEGGVVGWKRRKGAATEERI